MRALRNRVVTSFLAALLIGGLLGGCATRPPEDDPEAVAEFEEANDPYEPFNRAMWDVNMALDKAILQPITWFYRTIIPEPLRGIFSNVARNARQPLTIVNSLLQGKFSRAGTATQRLLVNSVVGVAGIADPASAWGIEDFEEDFGQTLAVWGVGNEPYLVLPVIGPTNLRDVVGFAGDSLSEPVPLALDIADHRYPRIGWSIGSVIESRDRNWQRLKEVRSARDPYVFARSAFRQNRRFEIYDGDPPQSEREQDLFDQDFEDDFEEAASDEPNGNAADFSPTAAAAHDPFERVLLSPDFRLQATADAGARQAPRPSGPGFSLR